MLGTSRLSEGEGQALQCDTSSKRMHLESIVEDFHALVQLHVLADSLVQGLHTVRSTPEILWCV